MNPKPILIEVVSDAICPWCFVGKRRLERALASRPELAAKVEWRPFMLNPDMPPGGMDRATYMRLKFGGTERAQGVYQPIVDAGKQEGIAFAFDRIARTPATIDAHRLIRWARNGGLQDAVVEALFRRYFLEGEDIGRGEVLVAVAEAAGMDAALVGELLAKDADVELIRAEDRAARAVGISGVPCFVIDQRYAVPGAQDPEIIAQVLDLAAREARGEGESAAAPP
ncbi:MAG: DsbA family oxidoreductase [Alphaproteobacteria bacterium]|nr:DsbA family oxidoreductase [Alphaproteobacteria bacterium]